MQTYCIDTNTWSDGPNLVVARQGHSSCTLDNHIYVFGDCDVIERAHLSVRRVEGLVGVKYPEWHSDGWQTIFDST